MNRYSPHPGLPGVVLTLIIVAFVLFVMGALIFASYDAGQDTAWESQKALSEYLERIEDLRQATENPIGCEQ